MNKKIISSIALTAFLIIAMGTPVAHAADMNSMNSMNSSGSMNTMNSMSMMGDVRYGMSGASVSSLQSFLQSKGFLDASMANGMFDYHTYAALLHYQASVGLKETGNFDAMTRAQAGNMNMGMSMDHMMSGMPSTMTKAADLRTLLNSINREHANLASVALRKGFDGATDFDASFKALDNNSIEIGHSIGSVYGADAEAQFLAIWRSHITYFKNYTVASKTHDEAGKAEAVRDLADYVNNISTFFSHANPNLPFDAVHGLVSTHVALLKDTIDKYFAGDLTGSYMQQHATDVQIGTGVADAVAGAIVKQYPERF